MAGIAALLRGGYRAPKLSIAGRHATSGPASQSASQTAAAPGGAGASAASRSGLPVYAVKLALSSRLPRGQAALYQDPASGQPDILIRQGDGSLNAFSAVCTHAGCTVGYEGGQIVCRCHGGVYSAQTGQVLAGPPPAPPAAKKVLEAGGEIYTTLS